MSEETIDIDNNHNSSDTVGLPTGGATAMPSQKTHPMEILLKSGVAVNFSKPGDIVEGKVLDKEGSRLFIDLGPRGTGIVYGREYYAAQDIIKSLKPGDEISAKVIEPDNEEGYTELSLQGAGEERKWTELKAMAENKTVLELPVLEANRGGLILEARGIKGFLPASQLSYKNYPRVEGGDKEKIYLELQKLVGKPIRVKILDADPAESKLIFTEKEVDQETLRQALSKYKVGDMVEGEITGVVDFGAFMKFRHSSSYAEENNPKPEKSEESSEIPHPAEDKNQEEDTEIEGLIHISEIDWTLIEDPREVLKPGEKVRAKIIDIQGDKVSLSLKALKEDPWMKMAEKYKKGYTIRGKAARYNPFGVFVELENQIQGLVHISEFGSEQKMREEIELNKEYDFKILLIDPAEHKVSLGMIRDEKIENPDVHKTQLEAENTETPKD